MARPYCSLVYEKAKNRRLLNAKMIEVQNQVAADENVLAAFKTQFQKWFRERKNVPNCPEHPKPGEDIQLGTATGVNYVLGKSKSLTDLWTEKLSDLNKIEFMYYFRGGKCGVVVVETEILPTRSWGLFKHSGYAGVKTKWKDPEWLAPPSPDTDMASQGLNKTMNVEQALQRALDTKKLLSKKFKTVKLHAMTDPSRVTRLQPRYEFEDSNEIFQEVLIDLKPTSPSEKRPYVH